MNSVGRELDDGGFCLDDEFGLGFFCFVALFSFAPNIAYVVSLHCCFVALFSKL